MADHTYEVGDRFEDLDPRSAGRIIELREVVQDGKFRAQVEAYPYNPTAVGRHTTLSPKTLDRNYRKISRG